MVMLIAQEVKDYRAVLCMGGVCEGVQELCVYLCGILLTAVTEKDYLSIHLFIYLSFFLDINLSQDICWLELQLQKHLKMMTSESNYMPRI